MTVTYRFRPMDRSAASQIIQWRYEPPYDIYNDGASSNETSKEAINWYLNPDFHYYSVWLKNDLVAFRSFGADAQVLGGDYSAEALDMGGGLRPDLTGKGHGAGLMTAVFEFARDQFNPQAFRATVAGFNLRAQKVCLRVGYHEIQRFVNKNSGKEFVVFWKPIEPSD